MTVLTTNQRLHLRRALISVRPDWHPAGTDAAILELEQRLNDAEQVFLTAIRTAFNPRALLPAAMLHDQTPATRIVPQSTRRPEWCGKCDPQTRLEELYDPLTDEWTMTRCERCHPLMVGVHAFERAE